MCFLLYMGIVALRFRVPLALPVLNRCVHVEAVKKSITWPFAPRTSVGALLNSEFSSPVSLGFTVSQRSFAERTATWTPHPRDFVTASSRNEHGQSRWHPKRTSCFQPVPSRYWRAPPPRRVRVERATHPLTAKTGACYNTRQASPQSNPRTRVKIVKGPYQRLKYELRRVWECPDCHHREQTPGSVTFVYCRCQRQKEVKDHIVMKLVDDTIRRVGTG